MSFFTPELIMSIIGLAGGAFSGLMANNQKMLLASIEATKSFAALSLEASDAAAQRNKGGASFLQRVVGILIVAIAFGGLVYAAQQRIDVTYLYETVTNKFLFWGGKEKIESVTATGFVIPPYVGYSALAVVNFLFGASVVKLRRV